MLLSIIIPIYNCEKYIHNAIESVINQNMKNYEIIIINDGSTDKSLKVCESYCKKYTNIKLITQENKGVSVARNVGIKEAKGKYLMFLDADDMFVNGFFDNFLIDELNKGFDILIFSSYLSNLKHNRYAIDSLFKDCIITDCIWSPSGTFASCVYSKELLLKNNIYFDDGIRSNEDQVFKFKAFYSATKIRMYSKFCYIYNATEGSVMKTLNGVYDIVDAWNLAKQWLINTPLQEKTYKAISYVDMKIKSRALLYAKNYVQVGYNKKQLINELKKRNIYDLLMSIHQQEVLSYLSNDLHLFQNNLDKFISKSKSEGRKIKYGRLLLKIPLIRYIRDIKKYPLKEARINIINN